MQDTDKNRVIMNLDEVVLFSGLSVGLISVIISLLCTIHAIHSVWFWATILVFLIGIICLICISIATYACLIIDDEKITIKKFNGKYLCLFSNVNNIEHRITTIGKEAIFVHAKESMHFFRHGKLVKKKDRINYPLPKRKKIISLLKQYLPKEIPWVYNDYFKNPNLEPKKPKKK